MVVAVSPKPTDLSSFPWSFEEIQQECQDIRSMVDGNRLIGKPGAYFHGLAAADLMHQIYHIESFRQAILLTKELEFSS